MADGSNSVRGGRIGRVRRAGRAGAGERAAGFKGAGGMDGRILGMTPVVLEAEPRGDGLQLPESALGPVDGGGIERDPELAGQLAARHRPVLE